MIANVLMVDLTSLSPAFGRITLADDQSLLETDL